MPAMFWALDTEDPMTGSYIHALMEHCRRATWCSSFIAECGRSDWGLTVWSGVGQGNLVLELGLGENFVDVIDEAAW